MNNIFIKSLGMVLVATCISLYFFPFEFSFLPGLMSKNIMAALGLVFFGFNITQNKQGEIARYLFELTGWAALFSIACFIAITLNNTPDISYASYIVSMWVWLGGAYASVNLIKLIHGRTSMTLLVYYLTAVCVFQCIIALIIDTNPAVQEFVDTYTLQNQALLHRVHRTYGIGAWLDIAGSRFACVLGMIATLLVHKKTSNTEAFLLITSFVTIVVLGNMIARTTTVGLVLGGAYIAYATLFRRNDNNGSLTVVYKWFSIIILCAIPLLSILYNTDEVMHKQLRFAFEGFFSLVEKGRWETSSNEVLKNMVVWPDNLKTWLIGDGYFDNPRQDPFFTGRLTGGYYMGTDVGYCRFIFYCGLPGLLLFSWFIIRAGVCTIRIQPSYKYTVLMIMFINFFVWMKVATDVFLVLALMCCIDPETTNTSLEDNEKNLLQTI